jgi:hypothetical protein
MVAFGLSLVKFCGQTLYALDPRSQPHFRRNPLYNREVPANCNILLAIAFIPFVQLFDHLLEDRLVLFSGQAPKPPWLRFAESLLTCRLLRSRTNAFASFLEKKKVP